MRLTVIFRRENPDRTRSMFQQTGFANVMFSDVGVILVRRDLSQHEPLILAQINAHRQWTTRAEPPIYKEESWDTVEVHCERY